MMKRFLQYFVLEIWNVGSVFVYLGSNVYQTISIHAKMSVYLLCTFNMHDANQLFRFPCISRACTNTCIYITYTLLSCSFSIKPKHFLSIHISRAAALLAPQYPFFFINLCLLMSVKWVRSCNRLKYSTPCLSMLCWLLCIMQFLLHYYWNYTAEQLSLRYGTQLHASFSPHNGI